MKKLLMGVATMLALGTVPAMAQSLVQSIVSAYQAEGYSRIEVNNGSRYITVEAIRNGQKVEAVYDARTGALVRQGFDRVDDDDDTRPGVHIRGGGDDRGGRDDDDDDGRDDDDDDGWDDDDDDGWDDDDDDGGRDDDDDDGWDDDDDDGGRDDDDDDGDNDDDD